MTTPLNVGWGFTKACNLNCRHCYNSSGGKRGKDELSLGEARKVVDKLAKKGIKTINYGTGESGLVPEFWDLVKYVDSKGIKQGLTTNGYSVNHKTINNIKRYMNDIDISLDFYDKKKHNWFRNSKFSWDWAINAMDLLAKNNMSFSIVTCITSINCDRSNLDALLKLSKSYGCDLRVNWFRPTGRGKYNKRFTLTVGQVNKTFRYLVKHGIIKALPDPYFSALLGLNIRKGCPCGQESFRITPSGKVVPCVYFTTEMDNLSIVSSSLTTILKSKPFRSINNRKIRFCKGCEFYDNCRGGCASRAYLAFGSMSEPDAFCYKKAGLKKNPFKNLKYTYKPGSMKVHENYLCTLIVSSK